MMVKWSNGKIPLKRIEGDGSGFFQVAADEILAPFAVEIGHLDAALRRVRPIKMLIDPVDRQAFNVHRGADVPQYDAPVRLQRKSI